jgi:hypothetical protein
MISSGRPFSQYQFSKKRIAQSSAESVVVVGMMCMSECSLSVMVNMQLTLLLTGNSPMKSIEIESPQLLGMGNECKGPVSLDVELLCISHALSTQGNIA